jgi:DNA-directed RNA polymerase specialized sigma24 family protein
VVQQTLRALTLNGIAHRCARETELFFHRQEFDPRYCFELFRRAIVDRCQRAWEFIYDQYRPQVIGWAKRHPSFPATGEEAPYFVNRAFEKMWAALSPAKFSRFPNLQALLRYLQMCVHSAIVDSVRTTDRPAVDLPVEALAPRGSVHDPVVENQVLERMDRQELWQAIDARLRGEQERRVVYGSFVLGLKPRNLYEQFRDTFEDVHQIYRIKENLLARLRRDAELERFLNQNA